MRNFYLFLLLLSFTIYADNNPEFCILDPDSITQQTTVSDDWLGKDKGSHLAGSFIMTGLLTLSADRFMNMTKQQGQLVGVSVSFSLSIGKEIYDNNQQNNHFSVKDLTADMLGILLALLIFK